MEIMHGGRKIEAHIGKKTGRKAIGENWKKRVIDIEYYRHPGLIVILIFGSILNERFTRITE